jgi:hypothetical protein
MTAGRWAPMGKGGKGCPMGEVIFLPGRLNGWSGEKKKAHTVSDNLDY